MREEREEGACKRPNESVHSNGAVGIKPVAVDQVAQALPERHHAAEADERD